MDNMLHIGDEVIQIVDSRLIYVKSADGNIIRIDVHAWQNGANNIVIEYERSAV